MPSIQGYKKKYAFDVKGFISMISKDKMQEKIQKG